MFSNINFVASIINLHKNHWSVLSGYLSSQYLLHRQQINHPELRQIDLSGHLATCAKGRNPQFHIIPFFKIKEENETKRKTMEKSFYKKVQTGFKQNVIFL